MRRFQVIQGGKKEGMGSSGSVVRLFRAYTVGNLTKGSTVYYDVTFNWYCLERDEPPVAYEESIEGYERLEDRYKSLMEKDIKRYFTEEEARALRAYLTDRYGMDLQTEEVALPIKERAAFFGEGSSVIYDFMELSEREGYSLSFKVWGYYTLHRCITSPSLDNGARFLEKALDLLDLPMEISRARLEEVAKALYDQEGLVVESRKENT